MGFLDRFKKKDVALDPIDFSLIGVDMHSHLIPGIDDGSKSLEQTLVMLAKFESLGYKKVITTPHIMSDVYLNTPDIILGGLEQVRNAANDLGLSISIEAAAEYYFDETLLARLHANEELLTFGNNCVLFEFSFHAVPDRVEQLIFELKTRGYQPILAHFERYLYYHGNPQKASWFRDQGVWIQLNLNSLGGHYGPEVQRQAEQIVKNNWVDLVGTDCHRIEHLMILEKNSKRPYFHKLLQLNLQNKNL